MKILLANIGGSTGYVQVLDRLKSIEDHNNIPDTLVTLECGTEEKFTGLEPFFTETEGKNNIRVHHSATSVLRGFTFHKTLDICHITHDIDSKHKVGLIFAYRNHKVTPKIFFNEIIKIIKSFKTIDGICKGGDFNTTLDNKSLEDLMDSNNLSGRTKAKHKHRAATKAYQIDHIISNISPSILKVNVKKSLETISVNNPDLGHPSFMINIESNKEVQDSKLINITNWNNVVKVLNSSNPVIINLLTGNQKYSDILASVILLWINDAIQRNVTTKLVKIKRIFKHEDLLKPTTKPNPNNMKAWKNFYTAVNNLRQGYCKINDKPVNPTQFKTMLQTKLTDMPEVDNERITSHIDKICG